MTHHSFLGPIVISQKRKGGGGGGGEGGAIIRSLRLKIWHPLESTINIQGSKTLTP